MTVKELIKVLIKEVAYEIYSNYGNRDETALHTDRWLGILHGNIYQLNADILLFQTSQDHFSYGGLNLVFAGGQHIIYRVAADDGTDGALADIEENFQRIFESV